MQLIAAILLLLFTAISSNALDHPSIHSRQYVPHRSTPCDVLARRAFSILSGLTSIDSALQSPILEAQSALVALSESKSESQKLRHGESLVTHVEKCHQVLQSVGGVNEGAKKAKPSASPSAVPFRHSGGRSNSVKEGSASAAEVTQEYIKIITALGTLAAKVDLALTRDVPHSQRATLEASIEGIQEELILILDVAESTAPGTKKVVHKLYEKLERSTQKALLSLSFQGYF